MGAEALALRAYCPILAQCQMNDPPFSGVHGIQRQRSSSTLHLLGGIRPLTCGCGRDWGCIEAYTTISGLPQLLAEMLKKHPGHPLATSPLPPKEKALTLRGLAQKGDALALDIFDFQARALGLA